jgi:protein-tyrosine kinase
MIQTIGCSDRNIENLFFSVASLMLRDDPIVLQFVASRPGEGSSLVASQFATVAARLQSGSVLFVDCTGAGSGKPASRRRAQRDLRPSLLEALIEGGSIDRGIAKTGSGADAHVAVMNGFVDSLCDGRGDRLANVLDLARSRHRLVVLDTPSLEESASTLLFSRFCDGVILVLEADATPARAAENTLEAIERSGGKNLGIVFNKRRIYMPRWLFRRL